MKPLSLVAALGAVSSPAWAHGGAHMHPHGTEVTPILVGIAVLVSAYFFLRSR